MRFKTVKRSLSDLVGDTYIDAVCRASAWFNGETRVSFPDTAREPIDFWPDAAGIGHLMGLWFHDLDTGKRFAETMVDRGFDLSVQSYKSVCPPAALTKLPLIADPPLVDTMIHTMRTVLTEMGGTQ